MIIIYFETISKCHLRIMNIFLEIYLAVHSQCSVVERSLTRSDSRKYGNPQLISSNWFSIQVIKLAIYLRLENLVQSFPASISSSSFPSFLHCFSYWKQRHLVAKLKSCFLRIFTSKDHNFDSSAVFFFWFLHLPLSIFLARLDLQLKCLTLNFEYGLFWSIPDISHWHHR